MWKVIPNFPNYMINANGVVMNKKFDVLKQRLSRSHRKGYMVVELYNKGTKTKRSVHSLVMEVFCSKRKFNLQINHIDGDTTNNKVENLEYVTSSENIKHAFDTGLMCNKGDNAPKKRLDSTRVIEIKKRIKDGEKTSVLAKEFGITQSMVSSIKYNRTWGHINV